MRQCLGSKLVEGDTAVAAGAQQLVSQQQACCGIAHHYAGCLSLAKYQFSALPCCMVGVSPTADDSMQHTSVVLHHMASRSKLTSS
jgi:hypothetical protein